MPETALRIRDMPFEVRAVRRRVRDWTQTLVDFGDKHIWLPIGTTLLSLIALIVVVNFAPSRPDPRNPGETHYYGWGHVALPVVISVFVLCILYLFLVFQARHGETRAERIKRLTKALEEAMQAITQIQTEIEDGALRLQELEEKTNLQRELSQLSESEAAAVREALGAELSRDRRRSLLRDLVLVLLGAALSYFLTRFF